MFIHNRGFTEVVGKARAALEHHEQFVGWGGAATDSELRATVHWKGDDQRLADLNVFLVSIPRADAD